MLLLNWLYILITENIKSIFIYGLIFSVISYLIYKFKQLESLYQDWNLKINVVSRKDIDELYLRHVLHSLGIAKVIQFKSGSHILDVGTGGGLVDLSTDLVPTYIADIPMDPATGTAADTQYTIYLDANGRVVASASSELNPGTAITVQR